MHFFKLPIDEAPTDDYYCREDLKSRFMKFAWWETYNFTEFVAPRLGSYSHRVEDSAGNLNLVLEREMSGYRLVGASLTPISSPLELQAVSEAATRKSGFEGVAIHMGEAAALLGKRPEPDYRNSIKESISAIEAAVKLVTGEKTGKGGVDKALGIIERRGEMHAALKAALSKLYGYTSDQDGVRHAILDQKTITFGEAKFMLVACSAFVNLVLDASSRPRTS
jgi:AbiJ N-terminal domain 4